jgi:hypothetical protein
MVLETLLAGHKERLRKDLENVLEQVICQVADAKELNPFDLILRLSAQGDQAIAEVLTKKKVSLHDFDAGDMIEELLEKQLEILPAIARKLVLERIGNTKIRDEVRDSLKDNGAILIRYDDNYKFQYYQQKIDKMKRIDIDAFFANISF